MVLFPMGLQGQTTQWTAGTGDWFTAGNWNNGVPNAVSSDAIVDNGGTAQIATGGAAETFELTVGTNNGSGTVQITNGSLAIGDLAILGLSSGANTGTLTVSGSGASVTHTADFFRVGSFGTGILNIDTGGSFVSSSTDGMILGANSGSAGTVNLGGTPGSRGVLQARFIGEGLGDGAIEWNGGILQAAANQSNFLQGFEAGDVTINAGGATLDTNGFDVGVGVVLDGTGDLTKTGTGVLTLSGASTYGGKTIVEGGSLVVTGSLASTSEVYGGNSYGGTNLTLSSGGTVTTGSASIGVTAASDTNTALVTGTGSTLTVTGDLNVGFQGSDNTLTIQSAGKVQANATKIGGYDGSTGNEVVVSGTNSLLSNTTYIAVGYGGDGNALTIQNGGKASNADAFVGYRFDGSSTSDNNEVLVTGTGSLWENTGTFSLGYYGDGNTLQIAAGGKVTVNGTAKDALIGFDAGSSGNGMIVTGPGSQFANNATFYIGNNGQNNTLDVLAGGLVTSMNVRIGGGAASTGNNATVDGTGSVWNIGGTLRVGSNGGSNSLDITGGGVVNVTGNSFVGYASTSSNNTVTVSGTGSLLDANALVVGRDGTNNLLLVEAGGEVEATSLTLAQNAGSSGTLRVGSGGPAGIVDVATITGGSGTAAVQFNHTGTASFAFTLAGSLSVAKSGAGTSTLAGNNTYTGGTTVSGGVLAYTGTSNLGSGTMTVAGGELQVLSGGQLTTGTGFVGVTGTGSGIAVVDGTGSSWTVNGDLHLGDYIPVPVGGTPGTLRVTDNASVQVNGQLELDINGVIELGAGGKVQATGGMQSVAGTVRLLANTDFWVPDVQISSISLTFDTNGFSGAYDGVISGTGPLAKRGAGVLTLTGNSTHTGNTFVHEGSLIVNGTLASPNVTVQSGAALGGTGTLGGLVVVEAGGTLAPGTAASTGVITLGGLNLNAGSTTRLRIKGTTPGTDYDQITVTGSAALGGTLDLVFGGFVPEDGDSFVLLTAGGGLGGSTFDTVTDNLGAALQLSIVYTATDVGAGISSVPQVAVEQLPFAGFGATPNQRAVGRGLDGLFGDKGTTDLIRTLNTLNEEALREALAQLSPEELAALSRLAFQQFQGQFNAFNNRFAELRNGGPAISVAGIRLYDPSGSMQLNPQTLLADTGLENVQGVLMKKLEEPVAAENRWGLYLDGTGTFTDIDGDGNGDGYDFTAGGMTLGTDYRINDNVIAGFQAGYTHTDADFGGAGGDMDADSANFGLTLGWMGNQGTYAHALVGGSYHSFETERNVLGQKATGETDGLGFNTAVVIGHEFGFGQDKAFKMGPEAALKYSWLNVDEYTEKDALGALTIQEQTPDSLKSRLGWRMSYNGNIGKVRLMPWFYAGWEHEYLDAGQSVAAAFPGSPASGFTVQGVEVARDSAVLGVGITAGLTENVSAKLSYDTEVSEDLLSQSVNGAVRVGF
jgi:T5SS/PEP-CTERM-associated repeat protein/autotransporter-associated beta strand protein